MQFPNQRLTYAGIEAPLFCDEIKNALSALNTTIELLLGIGPTDFVILSGFVLTGSAYSGGYVYMQGQIYYCAAGVNVGQYLIPSIVGIESKQHQDLISRNTYQVYNAVANNTSGAGGSPVFTSNMDAYRSNILIAQKRAYSLLSEEDTTITISDSDTTKTADAGITFHNIHSTRNGGVLVTLNYNLNVDTNIAIIKVQATNGGHFSVNIYSNDGKLLYNLTNLVNDTIYSIRLMKISSSDLWILDTISLL